MWKVNVVTLVFAVLQLQACTAVDVDAPNRYLVNDQVEYAKIAAQLQPGDTVVLANGVWKDFEILFTAIGTEKDPITLRPEEKGKVILSGKSNLRIAGEHLVVRDLVFKNGYTPTSAVISFRRGKGEYANHSRVTGVVIDRYNNPERTETDFWVMMYGKHNRFDHNHLSGKSNRGVTMAVRLNTEESRENHHVIENNYFGPREILGSNGGETLRIGTSHYSLSNSYTVVQNNYFDRCDGELEIISNKSANNVISGNVFYESRGTLTLRHGNGNLLENNVFFGNDADHTGGIRVINADQTIRNNYMEGLAGYRFGGALVVMNGVPNSPINRYHQVENAIINNNSLVNSQHVQLAAGSDVERSAVPINSSMSNNLFYSKGEQDIFTIYDDVSGIDFSENAQNKKSAFGVAQDFKTAEMTMIRADNGLLYPTDPDLSQYGVSKNINPVKKDDTGVSWYPKPSKSDVFNTGSVVNVMPEESALALAVKQSKPGDKLVLAAGDYTAERVLEIKHPLTIESADGTGTAKIEFERSALFEIQDGGSLYLKGLSISGASSPDSAGNTMIRTQRGSMLKNYELIIEESSVSDLDINHSFHVLSVAKSTFANRVRIANSSFSNITGAILKLDAENDDYGIYNAEYVDIEKSTFESVQGALVDYYRGGTDESTFGPHFVLKNSQLKNVGNGKRNKSAASILLHGVQVSLISDNVIESSKPIKVRHTVGEPVTRIVDNTFVSTPKLTVVELNSEKSNTALLDNNRYR